MHCGVDRQIAQFTQAQPRYAQRLLAQEQAQYEHWLAHQPQGMNVRNVCEVAVIPIVFHVLYVSASANITDAQIFSQVAALNQDFRRLEGSPGDGPGADTRIQFCLATKDPLGNSSPGITRTNTALALHKTLEEQDLKQLIAWDDQRYLNVWVVESLTQIDPNGQLPPSDILAYASFPTFPNGLPQGVVIHHRSLGVGGSAVAPFNAGRTLTHEIGHFLGLYHPFEAEGTCAGATASSCTSAGDRVCDTPSQLQPTYGCPASPGNTCLDRPCDGPDPAFNYLNYTDDACMNAFTQGQADRMHFFLSGARASLVSPTNLALTGCTQAPLTVRPRAAFSSSASVACPGESLQFEDQSTGCPDQWQWYFPGGNPAIATIADPLVTYASPGTYAVSLVLHNAAGSDTIHRPTQVVVAAAVPASGWRESFEPIVFPPPGWQSEDEDVRGSWLRSSLAAYHGQHSAVMPHFLSASCGYQDILLSPPLNPEGKSWELRFVYAYQARSADPGDADELEVAVTDTCGGNWITVFFRAGIGLATVPGFLNSGPFVPTSPQHWLPVVLDLSSFSTQGPLRIRFRTLGRHGQQLYLDDVQLSSLSATLSPLDLSPSVGPNPFDQSLQIRQASWAGKQVRLTISSLQGQPIATASGFFDPEGACRWQLAPVLVPGTYLLRIEMQGHTYTQLVVRQE